MFLPHDGLVANVAPTLDTSAYATGDVLFAANRIQNATLNTQGMAVLRGLVVIDTANQKAAIDLLIFNQDPGSLGALNAALDISTTQLGYLIGMLSVASADYSTLKVATNAVACKLPNLMLQALKGSKDVWVAGVSRGAPTYAADSLLIKAILERQA